MRGLEILLGLIFHSVEGCQSSVVAILKGESAIASPGGRGEEAASTVNVLVDAWRDSSAWKELESILSTVESGEDEELTARDLHDRLDEALKRALSIKEETATRARLCADSPPDSLAVLLDHGSTPDVVGPATQRDGGTSTSRTGAIENPSSDIPHGGLPKLSPDWSQLLDIYFANTNCWIPIVLRNDTFRVAYTVSTGSGISDVNQLPLGDQACLFSILAYAKYTQCITIGKNGSWKDLQDQFANLFAQASQLITTYESRRDVGDIQAMLVFTLLHYAQGNLALAWSLVGKAVYHSVELGLLKSRAIQFPPLDDRSRRVILNCFVLETLLSARLRRRPYMRTSDIQSIGLLDADGIEEWEPWRPTSLSSSALAPNLPRPSHQPAKILSTFNLLVQTSTIMNDKLQCHTNDTDTESPQEHLDIFHLVQSQIRLDTLVAESEAHGASPQALNLMLATLACFPHLVSAGTDAGYRNAPRSNTITLPVHQTFARVVEGVKQQGAVTLSPVSDVYLHIMESRSSNATSPFSREALESIKYVREIRAMYNETWRNTSLDPRGPVQATTLNQTESISATKIINRAPSVSASLQPAGWVIFIIPEVNGELTADRLTPSRRAPPNDARYTGDAWPPLMTPLQMAGPSDLFSSLVSLDNDDRCVPMIPFTPPAL